MSASDTPFGLSFIHREFAMEQDVDRQSAERTPAFRKGVLGRMQGSADHQGNSAIRPAHRRWDLSAIAPAVWRLRAAMATISVPFGMKRDAVSGVWIDSR
jgi:hypothetical protein